MTKYMTMTLDIKKTVKIKTKLYGEKTISYQGPTFWNKLPKHLKETTSIPIFKSKLRKYILEKY